MSLSTQHTSKLHENDIRSRHEVGILIGSPSGDDDKRPGSRLSIVTETVHNVVPIPPSLVPDFKTIEEVIEYDWTALVRLDNAPLYKAMLRWLYDSKLISLDQRTSSTLCMLP